MATINVYYNGLSGNGRGRNDAEKVRNFLKDDEPNFVDITKTKIEDVIDPSQGKIILCGGDGTLNHFVNDIAEIDVNVDEIGRASCRERVFLTV